MWGFQTEFVWIHREFVRFQSTTFVTFKNSNLKKTVKSQNPRILPLQKIHKQPSNIINCFQYVTLSQFFCIFHIQSGLKKVFLIIIFLYPILKERKKLQWVCFSSYNNWKKSLQSLFNIYSIKNPIFTNLSFHQLNFFFHIRVCWFFFVCIKKSQRGLRKLIIYIHSFYKIQRVFLYFCWN